MFIRLGRFFSNGQWVIRNINQKLYEKSLVFHRILFPFPFSQFPRCKSSLKIGFPGKGGTNKNWALWRRIYEADLPPVQDVIYLSDVFVTELEDMSNIMRVISLKNYCENTRVVIQLLQYQNKVKIETSNCYIICVKRGNSINIPESWN